MEQKYYVAIAEDYENDEYYRWTKKVSTSDPSEGWLFLLEKMRELYDSYKECYDTWERYIKGKNFQDFLNGYELKCKVRTEKEMYMGTI